MSGDTTITADGRKVEISRPDKVLFPQAGLTKRDLVEHYLAVAAVALPHYPDPPASMQRFPDGIGAEGFFQKQIPDYAPDWIDRVELPKEGGSISYVVANDAATLAWLANQGCITLHLGLSRRDRPQHPDRLIFDLDPPGDDFGRVQQAAVYLREILDAVELPSYVQTTGSRGLHLVVPLDRSADFDTVREFARDLAALAAERHPDELTVEQRKSARGDRVFLDYLRNAHGQTAVAPYSVRAIEGAPIATPVDWSEATTSKLTAQRYTVSNIRRRLAQKQDPWRDIATHGHSITAAARRLQAVR